MLRRDSGKKTLRACSLAILILAVMTGSGMVLLGNHFLARAAPDVEVYRAPDAPSLPDAYGYTWITDTYPMEDWVDLSGGTPITFTNPNGYVAVSLGFSFPFYEDSFSDLYIHDNGLITFGYQLVDVSERIPLEPNPNNFIAAFWDDLSVGYNNDGKIFYQERTGTPKSLVVEWLNVSTLADPVHKLSFEIILWETGKIDILYQDVNVSGETAAVGIEDSQGEDGLEYMFRQPNKVKNGLRVTFNRPPESNPRVKLSPNSLSGLLLDRQATLKLWVKNTSATRQDSYDFYHSFPPSEWSISFVGEDGRALADTTGDELPDTGPMLPGEVKNFYIHLRAKNDLPPGGFASDFTITARSQIDPRPLDISTLRIAVPYPFVTGYYDGAGLRKAILDLTWKNNQFASILQDPFARGDNLAIVRHVNKGYVYVWDNKHTPVQEPEYREIRFMLLNQFGGITRSMTDIDDHLSPYDGKVFDSMPSVAVTPNGKIGVAFLRQIQISEGNFENYIYFALRDQAGNPIGDVQKVTAVSGIYGAPVIAGITNNSFVVVWAREQDLKIDLWGAVYNSGGTKIVDETQITSEVGVDSQEPALTALRDGRVLLVYTQVGADDVNTIRYRILPGGILPLEAEKTIDEAEGVDPNAIELENGEALIAWVTKDYRGIGYAVLTDVDNPPATIRSPLRTLDNRKVGNVSLARDPSGKGILSWMDDRYHDYIYCAVIDPSGEVVIEPVAYLGEGVNTDFYSSFVGLGIATYDGAFRAELPLVRK